MGPDLVGHTKMTGSDRVQLRRQHRECFALSQQLPATYSLRIRLQQTINGCFERSKRIRRRGFVMRSADLQRSIQGTRSTGPTLESLHQYMKPTTTPEPLNDWERLYAESMQLWNEQNPDPESSSGFLKNLCCSAIGEFFSICDIF